MRVGTSEIIRVIYTKFFIKKYIYSFSLYKDTKTQAKKAAEAGSKADKCFNQWQAGYIDGDGNFTYSKKGYVAQEISCTPRDITTITNIKTRFGGSIKPQSLGGNFRYRLHHREGQMQLINSVNGEIRNPVRLQQLQKLLWKYDIPAIYSAPLQWENGWLSGMIDSDGSIYINLLSDQLFITISNNNKQIQDPQVEIYGGKIYATNVKGQNFKWSINKKYEQESIQEYFKFYPQKSAKINRIRLIPKYWELRLIKAHLADENSPNGKQWRLFQKKWDKFG